MEDQDAAVAGAQDAPEVVDAEVVDEGTSALNPDAPAEDPPPVPPPVAQTGQRPPQGAALAVRAETPALFLEDTSNPGTRIEIAERYATQIKDVIEKRKLSVRISGKDHVEIGGWQVAGTIARVAVHVVDTGPVRNPVTGEPHVTKYDVHVKDYEWVGPKGNRTKQLKAERDYTVEGWDWWARYEARLPDGTVVGASDAIVRRTEDKWAKDDDTALLGMAQTRASSRAYRSALGWIMHLAGYATTPADDMKGRRDSEERVLLPWWCAAAEDERRNRAHRAIAYMLAQPAIEEADTRDALATCVLAAVADIPATDDEKIGHVPILAADTLFLAGKEVGAHFKPPKADEAKAEPEAEKSDGAGDTEKDGKS